MELVALKSKAGDLRAGLLYLIVESRISLNRTGKGRLNDSLFPIRWEIFCKMCCSGYFVTRINPFIKIFCKADHYLTRDTYFCLQIDCFEEKFDSIFKN